MDLKAIGLRIQIARNDKNLTQEELADKAGLSVPQLSCIEHGKADFKIRTFVRIANALESSTDALLYDVVDYAVISKASELSLLVEKAKPAKKRHIFSIVEALLKEF